MTTTQGRSPSQTVLARELKAGDYILSRKWTVLAVQEEDGGNSFKVTATSADGLLRQAVLPAGDLVEITRG